MHKFHIPFLLVACMATSAFWGCGSDSNDEDDSFVNVGGQLWSKENLNIPIEGSFCYDSLSTNCEKYGRLYTWTMAMNIDESYATTELGKIKLPHQGICPAGSHLPSLSEWQQLDDYLNKHPSEKELFLNQIGGFYRPNSGFSNENIELLMWTSTEYDYSDRPYADKYNFAWLVVHRKNLTTTQDNPVKQVSASVRCIKNK
ncbi:major paralogous domain-containing protein [Fibrobacter sp. UWB13]|nr:major paralogous domain-containing protein [Fibrobacter sp. UWB13]